MQAVKPRCKTVQRLSDQQVSWPPTQRWCPRAQVWHVDKYSLCFFILNSHFAKFKPWVLAGIHGPCSLLPKHLKNIKRHPDPHVWANSLHLSEITPKICLRSPVQSPSLFALRGAQKPFSPAASPGTICSVPRSAWQGPRRLSHEPFQTLSGRSAPIRLFPLR